MHSRFVRAASRCLAISRCLLVIVAITTASVMASADTLFNDSAARHGKVVRLNAKSVAFDPGCNVKTIETIDWNSVDDIVFDSKCDSGGLRPAAAGGGICPNGVSNRFVILPKDGGKPRYADDVTLGGDGILHFTDLKKNLLAHGPVSEIAAISYRQVCSDEVSTDSAIGSFCVEPGQFAANFSYDAPLDNKVLTRGFSFYTEFLPSDGDLSQEKKDEIVATIRTGFGTALTNWFSGLQRRSSNYDVRLKSFVDSLVLKSAGGYQMLIPPQVIALQCPQSATFVVRVYRKPIGPFAAAKERKVAYAEKPGRTLVLNFADYPCWTHGYFKFVFDQEKRCVNIVSILTHELGHAFGLNHVKDSDSIMTPVIQVTEPSDKDVDRLAEKFLTAISGDSPGMMNFTIDNGVAIPDKP